MCAKGAKGLGHQTGKTTKKGEPRGSFPKTPKRKKKDKHRPTEGELAAARVIRSAAECVYSGGVLWWWWWWWLPVCLNIMLHNRRWKWETPGCRRQRRRCTKEGRKTKRAKPFFHTHRRNNFLSFFLSPHIRNTQTSVCYTHTHTLVCFFLFFLLLILKRWAIYNTQ